MLRIGYIRLRDEGSAEDAASLKAMGCHVVRAEEPPGPEADDSGVLFSILDFIGSGDQLVVGRLDHLAHSSRSVLDVMDRLEARGASLYVVDPELCSEGDGGRTLRAVLEAVSTLEPAADARRRRTAAAPQQIRALQRAGVGPVEIARRLGVSRMTVWRKLRALEA
ncbi:recombinase family protein [Phenylobacterium sp.]|uniref:recombinase family protein n=1 Tax=Phenylobacterium sp. TaxID=1871053 RepID=UPI00398368C0